ncbi:MAG: hypothetical protein AAF658_22070, partial [Myxococcota bacterium]
MNHDAPNREEPSDTDNRRDLPVKNRFVESPAYGRAAVAASLVVAAVSLGTWLMDARLQQGLSAEYRLQIAGVEEIVHRSHELRTWFPNQHRVLSRYVQNWPFERWDIPSGPPPIDV